MISFYPAPWILVIAVLVSTRVFRLARAVAINIVVMDYIEAAKLRGEGLTYLIFREILPNATAPLIAEFGLRFCFVFLMIAALSFLGLGIQPPLADWGTMVRDLSQFINFAGFGEVLGLIGESGAGKSTIGLAAMGFTRDGCRISGGTIEFDGIDLRNASASVRRGLLGKRIAYVAQSAAASFNPAHRLIDQHTEAPSIHGVMSKGDSQSDGIELYSRLRLPNPDEIGFRYPHQVSGGQLQRAMPAMAMAGD